MHAGTHICWYTHRLVHIHLCSSTLPVHLCSYLVRTHMAVPPSRTADAQALKRARSRYPLEPDDDGFYVRGRREEDGTWTPVPCACFKCLVTLPMVKFATVKEGVDHEFTALEERRAKWKNLASEQQSLAKHISAEHGATREAIEEEVHLARAAILKELKKLTQGICIEVEAASPKKLQATILQLQSAKRDKVKEAQKKKEEDRLKSTMVKKPRIAYWMWLYENRSSIVQEHSLQGKRGSEISKKAGEMWRNVDPAEKTKYEEKAAADKIRYTEEINALQHKMGLDKDENHRKRKRQDHGKSRKKKDPDAPKKPLSAYFYYLQEERNTIRDKFGISSGREFNKKAAEEWKTVPKEVKEKYQMMAFEAKEKYKKDNEANKAARKAGA